MRQQPAVVLLVAAGFIVVALPAVGMNPLQKTVQPDAKELGIPADGPFVITAAGDTTWLQVNTESGPCLGGAEHGGEVTGGPSGTETWCFDWWNDHCHEGGSIEFPPRLFEHLDMRARPSPTGVNYWHMDSLRTADQPYCGTYCLWCGSDSLWIDQPIECNMWVNPPGYGNLWNCIVELDLGSEFASTWSCTLYFDPRYDTECKYDYLYVDFYDQYDSVWTTVATFNGTSNNPGPECGAPTGGSPDYWGNTDAAGPWACDWQERSNPGEPAFALDVSPLIMLGAEPPRFRWRFVSDLAWSDADGWGGANTDGGAFIDNVWVHADWGRRYEEDFEHGSWATLAARGWSLPDPPGVIDTWYLIRNPDPPYEDEVPDLRTTCDFNSTCVFRTRPVQGYPASASWRNGWYCRLVSPRIPIAGAGCVVQYDQYLCTHPTSCDFAATNVRVHDVGYDRWCPWNSISGYLLTGGCDSWTIDKNEDVSSFYGPAADSIQFAWDFMDLSAPGSQCYGYHFESDHLVDNVSVGFFDGHATNFRLLPQDLLHDSFYDSVCAYSSYFTAYDYDSVAKYSAPSPPSLPRKQQLNVDVVDKDGLASVSLVASADRGATWMSVPMYLRQPADQNDPGRGGLYCGTLDHTDFGYPAWPRGTEVWYYVLAQDALANLGYLPSQADPQHADHQNSSQAYFSFTVLPAYPPEYSGIRVLLVDAFDDKAYDWDPCLNSVEAVYSGLDRGLEDVYEQTLTDAGYCFDKFDVSGGGSNTHIHCIWEDDYDAMIWFTGPDRARHLFDKEAQDSLRSYLAGGGKAVLCGDRLAFAMASEGEMGLGQDSLYGEFLGGIMGSDYLEEMESSFVKPFVYLEAAEGVSVFGTPVSLDLDTTVLYRECPGYLRDMSYVQATDFPPVGYTAQALLGVLDPGACCPDADGATYVEYGDSGQCVFLDFDLSAMVNRHSRYCSGATPGPTPDFAAGSYDGRVELMRVILEDIFGLPSLGPGKGGTSSIEDAQTFRWGLAQSMPNPSAGGAEIAFELASPGRVSIRIYDTTGRLVRTLLDERREAGRHLIEWDGRNHLGDRVACGVYFYRMCAGGFTGTRKLLIVD